MIINLKRAFFTVTLSVIVFVPDFSYALDRNGIDVVLILDSSGSMKKTDPMTLRIPAAKLFISLLSNSDRASVVSFSDKGYPVIYLTPVGREKNKDSLLRAADKISSEGKYTNLYDALNKGLEILTRDKDAEKKKIIILMSDGKMDVGDPDEDKRLVESLRNELIGRLNENGVKVYTIAFTEFSDQQLLDETAKETGGLFNLALKDKDLHMIFTSIFESLKAPEMVPLDGNKFFVDESIEEVTVVATKGSPDIEIYLQSPDGRRYSSREKNYSMKWFISHNFDMITVEKPAEGSWKILFSTEKDNKVYIITHLKLKTDFDKLYVPVNKPVKIEAWLEKNEGIIKERDILEGIDMFVEAYTPDGETFRSKPIL